MKASIRVRQPKRFAVFLWLGYSGVLIFALAKWYFAPRINTMHQSATEEIVGAQAKQTRIGLAASELNAIEKNLSETSASRQPPLLPLPRVKTGDQQAVRVADTVVIQSGTRLIVLLNGHPVTQGMKLPTGEVITRVTPQAITLVNASGLRRIIPLNNGFHSAPVNPKDESK